MPATLLSAITALGQEESSAHVQRLVREYATIERYDDPPGRHYLIASGNGISLLFESEYLRDLQIYVEPTKTRKACPYKLPFGIKRGMSKTEMHRHLGEPVSSDESSSTYEFSDYGARMVAEFDDDALVRYLSFAPAVQLK